MNQDLLDILCCPMTHRPLQQLDAERLARLNDAIGAGSVHNHGDGVVADPLGQALVTTDGGLVYPVRQGVPILLEGECINWSQIEA